MGEFDFDYGGYNFGDQDYYGGGFDVGDADYYGGYDFGDQDYYGGGEDFFTGYNFGDENYSGGGIGDVAGAAAEIPYYLTPSEGVPGVGSIATETGPAEAPYYLGGTQAAPAPDAKPPSMFDQALAKAKGLFTTENAGKAADYATSPRGLQAITGVAGAGLLAKGLLFPKSGLNLSKEEKASLAAMQQQRANLSRDYASRGYAGEEGLRTALNERLSGLLDPNAPVPPALQGLDRQLASQETALRRRLATSMGPGYEESTAGRNALSNFMKYRAEAMSAAREQLIGSTNQMAMGRSQFTHGLELDPLNAANMELGNVSRIGASSREANARENAAVMGTGGQLLGYSLGSAARNQPQRVIVTDERRNPYVR